MAFLFLKPQLFSPIHFILFFTTPSIPLTSNGILLGRSTSGRLLIVAYAERDEVVRLISAREVTSSERKAYEEG
jgi:hypothetical protein